MGKTLFHIILSVVASLVILTLTSFLNSFQSDALSYCAYAITYFICGIIISKHFNKLKFILPFLLVPMTVMSLLFFIDNSTIVFFLIFPILILLCFSFGLYFKSVSKKTKLIFTLSALASFYFVPVKLIPFLNYKIIYASLTKSVNYPFNYDLSGLLNKDGSSFKGLNPDTVYMLNFTFHSCLPCQLKKPSLERIATHFKSKAFRLINIHEIENFDFFKRKYGSLSNYLHDKNGVLAKKLSIEMFPFDLIINKKGVAVSSFHGFSEGVGSFYESERINLLNNLLNEKDN